MIILKTTEYLRCDTREDTSELLRILKDMGADVNYTGEQDGRGIFMIRAHSRSCIYVAKPFFTPTYCQKFTVGEEIYYSYEDMLNSGRYFSKSNLLDCDTDEVKFAKKSDLYNKIMLDGNVFNPYIHRRFLPHQYIHLIEQYSGDIDAAISREYHFKYALEYTKKEVFQLQRHIFHHKASIRFFCWKNAWKGLLLCRKSPLVWLRYCEIHCIRRKNVTRYYFIKQLCCTEQYH